jgi:hypothetical protein
MDPITAIIIMPVAAAGFKIFSSMLKSESNEEMEPMID